MDVSAMFTIFNNHGFDSVDNTEKLEVINDTLWEVNSLEPWPYLEKSVGLNFDGVNPYPANIPADFKAVLWLEDLQNGVPVWPIRTDELRQRFGAKTDPVDSPSYHYFIGSQLRLYPVPPADSTGRYLLDYIATQPALTATSLEASILMPFRHHRIIVLGALVKLYAMDDDSENVGVFTNLFNDKLAKMRFDLFKRQYMRGDHIYPLGEENYENPWPS